MHFTRTFPDALKLVLKKQTAKPQVLNEKKKGVCVRFSGAEPGAHLGGG